MNVAPGQLARVVAPFELVGRQAFVIVRRAWRGESVGGYLFTQGGGPAWVCSGWVRFDGSEEPLGPEVVLSDLCLRRVSPGFRQDRRDVLVAPHLRKA